MLTKYRYPLGIAFTIGILISTGIGHNPAYSVLSLLFLFSWDLADRYLHFFIDSEAKNLKELSSLKTEFSKLKLKQDQSDLKTAFGGRNVS